MNTTTIRNPIIWSDVPDVSVIRAGEWFYMVSTSMHMMPGCPIMKSPNLKDWELAGYVFDTLEDNDAHQLLDGKGIYSRGSWAASLRYHEGIFYVCFSSLDVSRFYVYKTRDIERGPWERHVIDRLLHDPALLFDNGRVFVFYGNGDIRIAELTSDATELREDGIHQLLLESGREGLTLRCEGCHAYRMNGYYYLFFIDWPSVGHRRRRVLCYRSRELLGPYEHRVVLDDDMGYMNQGVAQGGIVDTPGGEWFAVLFQDHHAVGRIPYVVPVTWQDDWPVFGTDGKVPEEFTVSLPQSSHPASPLVISDGFDYTENKLALNWQWNHNPDHEHWSVTERSGWLRLTAGTPATGILHARNTLTQRTEGPACSAETLLDTSGMQLHSYAGIVALQYHFGAIGVQVADNGERYVVMTVNGGDGAELIVEKLPYLQKSIYLKVSFDFRESRDIAEFFYSSDREEWRPIGEPLQLKYTLDHFMGTRIGLFHYEKESSGGHADFDFFDYDRLEG